MTTGSSIPLRLAMWSGPRNISTAMMRAWENRPDTVVVDEPFYACYLKATGLDHPGRDDVIASQSTDWQQVAQEMSQAPIPDGVRVFYQKHMTHHMLPDIDLGWISRLCNVFLIRNPAEVVASYKDRRGSVTLADIGIERQLDLFEREADRLGSAPPVIDSNDVLANPRAVLTALCQRIGLPFTDAMLSWPAGRRASDGVWAPHWYKSVEASTGFAPPPDNRSYPPLTGEDARIADQARPLYEKLARWRLT